uniref:Uncharacterized protein n=1 Tax=Oryza sativa subsp. japonica TaxID=39947 RepID=Q69Y25_ORYSJ|nr:hypothetical protein [Oryza sativa Japonica Group]BAD35302.1 hypothetical protein [Oryza sativa Japonica Group]
MKPPHVPFVKGWARREPAHGEDYPSLDHSGAIIEPTQPGQSDRSVVAGQTVHGSVRSPSARSDRLQLWRFCIATKNQISATDQWSQSNRPYHAGQWSQSDRPYHAGQTG